MLGGWLPTKHRGQSDSAGKGTDDGALREPLLRQQDDDLLNRSSLAIYTAKQPPHSTHATNHKSSAKASVQPAFVYGFIPTLRTLSLLQASVLAVMATVAGSVSGFGALLLLFLLLTRFYAPACVEIVRPLSFEYSEHGATAIAHLLQPSSGTPSWMDTISFGSGTGDARACSSAVAPFDAASAHGSSKDAGSSSGRLASERALPPGQKVMVAVTLHTPPQYSHTLFQVTGELLSDSGAPLARATRSWLSKPKSMAARARQLVFGWPLLVLGLVDDTRHLDMVLLPGYVERQDAPLVAFRARLTGRTPAEGAPSVYGGEVRVRLLLTWRQELLHALRPSPLVTVLLAAVGLAMMLGGGTAFVIVGGAAWFVYRWGHAKGGSSSRSGRGGAAALEDSAMDANEEHEWLVLAGKGGKGYGSSSAGHGSSNYGGGGTPLHKTPSMESSFFMVHDGASGGVGGSTGGAASPRYGSQATEREGGGTDAAASAFVGAGPEWSSESSHSRQHSPA